MHPTRPPIPFFKRCVDLMVCIVSAPIVAPVMLLAAAVIKLSSAGPVFYHAKRAGYRGQPFYELKFRTMHIGADRHGAFTTKNDSRVFPAGRILRLFKIDELPQIINVLKGEMSIVGPRPEDWEIVEECYSPEQRAVLEVAPGLTGFPQVRFFDELSVIDPGEMDPQEHYKKLILPMRLAMDLEYVRRRSFWVDLRLIAQTIYLIALKSWATLLFGKRTVTLPQTAGQERG